LSLKYIAHYIIFYLDMHVITLLMFNVPITVKYYFRYDPYVSTGRWSSWL